MQEERPEQWVEVPASDIPTETLESLVESFILREGTDYGSNEASLSSKIQAVLTQLKNGTAKIVYEAETETCTILSKTDFLKRKNEYKRPDPIS